MNNQIIEKTLTQLIEEGNHVLSTEFFAGDPRFDYGADVPVGVDLRKFAKWYAGCQGLLRMIGSPAQTWKTAFESEANTPVNAMRIIGTLEAIAEALKGGLLITVEDLVYAEAFNHLLDQADYLLSQNYFLAAGVLGRAVLEEHLRNWCQHKNFVPAKPKPTVNDFNQELYKKNEYSVSVMKHIEAMAAIGNDAAHNKPELTRDAVDRLLRDVRAFLAQHTYI